MSGIFENIRNSLSLSKKPDDLKMSKSCYTLFIHYNETEDFGEDPPEPAAFQIPLDMKWKDLQDLICTEVGSPTQPSFTYIDDERDIVQIDSQEEYEMAIQICREEGRDLHIYTSKSLRTYRRHKKKRAEEKKPDEFAVLPEQPKKDEIEILQPNVAEEEEKNSLEFTPQSCELSVESSEVEPAAPPYEEAAASAPAQEDDAAGSIEPDEEETTPMSGNSILSIIKKEVSEVVANELDDVWRFVNALKRDINAELDVIGEQLATHSAQLPEVQKQLRDQLLRKAEEEAREPEKSGLERAAEPEDGEEETNSFAATFICENLLDGSIVHTGESFEKFWVFRNDGSKKWDENTKLHLLDETCDPPVATGSSLSEWGAKSKSVTMPPLGQGESGVVCARHVSPAHGCIYNSSWRLSHKNNPFGPRVWCSVRVVGEVGSPVDRDSSVEAQSLESFEEVNGERSLKTSLATKETQSMDLQRSLVPQNKLQVEVTSPKFDEGHHNDNSIMSFNMDDISDGAKYIETTGHESVPFNPAVTTVEQHNKEEEPLHANLEKKDGLGASVDGEDCSISSGSPVMVSPLNTEEILTEGNQFEDAEEPRTLENETDDDDEDLYSSKYIENPDPQNHVENFTEPVFRTSDSQSSEEEEEAEEEEREVESAGEEAQRKESEDLHSVDYNLNDDGGSMTSYDVSDFVVVPLPECFDVNKPLNGSQYEEKNEEEPEPATEESTEGPVENPQEEEDPAAHFPPEDEESSDSEVDSQPSSTHIKEYKSEDSSIHLAPKSPSKSPSPPMSPTPKVDLPTPLATPQAPPSGGETPQPDSLDESLTEKITKEFEAFLSNPESPTDPPPKPKVPMNQMISTRPKVTAYRPDPKPVPQSVLNMDDPYDFQLPRSSPQFPPFEQGWRRNPIPVPASVVSDNPWPLNDYQDVPTPAPRIPRSEFTLNQNSNGIESTLPSHPFAVGPPSGSFPEVVSIPPRQRSPSPDIELADDFYPPGLEPAGSTLNQEPEDNDIFRTPPPSPPPVRDLELSPLDQLYEMGFQDIELNRNIYEQCGRDLNRTVQALVLRAEADEDMMA